MKIDQLISNYTTYKGNPIKETKSDFSIDEPKPLNTDVGRGGGMITVYEDNKVKIAIANPNDTTLTPAEFEAAGHDKRVHIIDKVSGAITFIEDVEMVNNFLKTFNAFLDENGVTMQDFIEYARTKFMGELFDTFIETMGWKVKQIPLENPIDIANEPTPAINIRPGDSIQGRITSVSYEPKSIVQPNQFQKISDNLFYKGYIN